MPCEITCIVRAPRQDDYSNRESPKKDDYSSRESPTKYKRGVSLAEILAEQFGLQAPMAKTPPKKTASTPSSANTLKVRVTPAKSNAPQQSPQSARSAAKPTADATLEALKLVRYDKRKLDPFAAALTCGPTAAGVGAQQRVAAKNGAPSKKKQPKAKAAPKAKAKAKAAAKAKAKAKAKTKATTDIPTTPVSSRRAPTSPAAAPTPKVEAVETKSPVKEEPLAGASLDALRQLQHDVAAGFRHTPSEQEPDTTESDDTTQIKPDPNEETPKVAFKRPASAQSTKKAADDDILTKIVMLACAELPPHGSKEDLAARASMYNYVITCNYMQLPT